ncbi:MAG: phosphopentomutase/phosphoglucosamine mutase [Methanomicrobiales archaeon]|nr:phosphopentomutase/phosphoglucosamine mutase [Methanomicrobiales archaeon]
MLFGSSGIRRKYDLRFVELAVQVGSAMGRWGQSVVVGMDTRTTSPLLAQAVTAGCLANGVQVRSCGIAPTPSVAYASRHADAGCMVTASHNPEEYNGLKLFNPDGSSFTQVQQAEMEEELRQKHAADWKGQEKSTWLDATGIHRSAILDALSPATGITAVLDCGNGAGSVLSPSLLQEAGVQVRCLNCNVSGRFARPSEPLAENLGHVSAMVVKSGADCGIAHDGDADRMVGFDRRGRYVDGDRMLMLFARYLDAKRVVTTVDASMAIEEIAEVERTPVGDTYVSEKLMEWGDFGGEPSGAWIFPRNSYCPDGPYAAALFCEIAGEWDIAAEVDRMPAYPIIRESFAHPTPAAILTALGAEKPTDGIRFNEEGGWCLIRASGTEPKIRLTAEGKTRERAMQLMEKGKLMVKNAKIQ